MKPMLSGGRTVIDLDRVNAKNDPVEDFRTYSIAGINKYHYVELLDVITKLSKMADSIVDTLADINERREWYEAPKQATEKELVEYLQVKAALQPIERSSWAYFLVEPEYRLESLKQFVSGDTVTIEPNCNALIDLIDVIKRKLYGAVDRQDYQWDSTQTYAQMLDPYATDASKLLIQLITVSNDSAWNEAFCQPYTMPLPTLLDKSSKFNGIEYEDPKQCMDAAVEWYRDLIELKMMRQVATHGSKWDPMHGDWDNVDGEAFDDGGYL